jgi:hypothetical protein
MSGRRLQFGVAVVDQRLYVVGGRDGLKTLNTFECYDIKSKTWTSLPSMSTHRHGLGNFCEHKYDTSCFHPSNFTVVISDMVFILYHHAGIVYK